MPFHIVCIAQASATFQLYFYEGHYLKTRLSWIMRISRFWNTLPVITHLHRPRADNLLDLRGSSSTLAAQACYSPPLVCLEQNTVLTQGRRHAGVSRAGGGWYLGRRVASWHGESRKRRLAAIAILFLKPRVLSLHLRWRERSFLIGRRIFQMLQLYRYIYF